MVTLLAVFAALCETACQEEAEMAHVTTDCEIKVGSTIVYAHCSILVAHSNFFRKLCSQKMSESQSGTVELKHVRQDMPRAALHTLLRFVYAGDTHSICFETAWFVLELLGAEDGDYFEIKDCGTLRDACVRVILEDTSVEGLPAALQRAHGLGAVATGLKQALMENFVATLGLQSLTTGSASNKLNQIIQSPELMLELMVLLGTCTVLKPGWRPSRHSGRTTLLGSQAMLTCSSKYRDYNNSSAALKDDNWTTGLATGYVANDGVRLDGTCHFIQASFDRPVRVKSLCLGIGNIQNEGWNRSHLDGAYIEYSLDGQAWTRVGTANIPSMNAFHVHELPEPTVAQYWRLMRDTSNNESCQIAVSIWKFA